MKKIFFIISLNLSFFFSAQINLDYSKNGKETYGIYLFQQVGIPKIYDKENAEFQKNARKLIDFFNQESNTIKQKQGFDLRILLKADENFSPKTGKRILKNYEYGIKAEIDYLFEMFIKGGKKWTVEPPNWRIFINNPNIGGHGGFYNDGDDHSFLKKIFLVFPLKKEIASGVHYYNCEAQTCGSIVVFNPNRPNYWIPVKVKEVTEAKLRFYNNDKDREVYNFLKQIVDAMREEELNADAYYGSEDAILNVNGKGQGLQIMRFNPDYWDKNLPISAIQFITIYHNELGFNCKSEDCWEATKSEFYKNNGHIEFWQEIPREIPLEKLGDFIQK